MKGILFGYERCNIEVPGNLRANFDNFTLIFKKTFVSENDLGDLLKNGAKQQRLLSQPRTMLISRFT